MTAAPAAGSRPASGATTAAAAAPTTQLTLFAALTAAGTTVPLTAEAGTAWRFSGHSTPGVAVPLGQLVERLASTLGCGAGLPAPLADLTVTDLAGSYDLTAQALSFGCTVDLPIGGAPVPVTVGLRFLRSGSSGWSFSASLTVSGFELALAASTAAEGDLVVASYRQAGASANLAALVRDLSPELAGVLPADLSVEVADLVLAYRRSPTGSAFLLVLDVDVSGVPALTALPLVGPLLPPSGRLALTALRVLVASDTFAAPLPAGVTAVPLDVPIAGGATLAAVFDVAGTRQVLSIPLGGPAPTPAAPAMPPAGTSAGRSAGTANTAVAPAAASTTPAPADGTHWITLEKSFGPVHLGRIGMSFQDSTLLFLIDGALTAAGLTLALDGLGFGSPLDHFAPVFTLRGLGAQYAEGPVEIGGAFLRVTRTTDGVTYDEYDGAAILKTPPFSLTAFGSYAYFQGQPSLFVYAVLDYPLGGPTFFFVTGLAGGFGYNRALHVPGVDTLAAFPLVAAATGGASASGAPAVPAIGGGGTAQNGLLAMLQRLEDANAIPPSLGDIFFALGIKFTSFEILDGFLLLTVAFGHTLEIDLLGLATLVLPTPEAGNAVTPLAEVQMAVKASFLPDQGFLGVAAQLTSASFLLSPDCHLTGGYAFSAWFSGPHAGDFVQTLGGYHPLFAVPAHYPQVPRLGINWRINDEISVKGGAYYALTASAAMAGGALQATWHTGSLAAWFDFTADFLIAWKPLHYDARLSADFGASYTFEFFGSHTISVDLSADLHLWGPDFSGTAHLDLSVVSFDVGFGAGATTSPAPLPFDGGDASFAGSFLPAASVCAVTVTGGLLSSFDDPSVGSPSPATWVINPLDFVLATNSLVPSKTASFGSSPLAHGGTDAFGIAPMNIDRTAVGTAQTITITRDGASVEGEFSATPILKPMPTALWGESITPAPGSPLFVAPALAGFTIAPAAGPQPGATSLILLSELDHATTAVPVARAVPANGPTAFVASAADDATRRQSVRASITAAPVVAARAALLTALGFAAADVTVGAGLADTFVEAPQVPA